MLYMADNLPKEKECQRCHQFKPLSEFSKNKNKKDGYSYLCKECTAKRLKKYTKKWAEERTQRKDISTEKECHGCHQVKPITEFSQYMGSKDGFDHLCKECKAKKQKEHILRWEKERAKRIDLPKEKECKSCHKIKPISEFGKDKHRKDGLYHVCKECKNKRHQRLIQRWEKKRSQKVDIPDEKTCIKCQRVLPVSQFTKSINYKDGLDNICKECWSQRRKENKARWREERLRKPDSITQKKCPSCRRVLPISGFYKVDGRKDGLSFYCKECELKKQREYSQKWEEERSQRKTEPKEKECNICHRVLPISKFYKNRRFKDGINATCIECETKRKREYIVSWKENRDQKKDYPPEKECIKCHRVLPISHFNKNKRRKDGLTSACKDCEVKQQEKYIVKWAEERKQHQEDDSFTLFPTFEKRCNICKRILPTFQFYKNSRRKDGLSSNCIECELKIAKDLRIKRKKKRRKTVIPKEKFCKKCQRLLPSSEFHKNCDSSDGLAMYCRECKNKMYKEYRNRPEVHKRMLDYWKQHSKDPKVVQRRREWSREYSKRPYVKQKRKAYFKEYYARPEVKERRKQYLHEYYRRPEVKEKMKLYYKQYNERKKEEKLVA